MEQHSKDAHRDKKPKLSTSLCRCEIDEKDLKDTFCWLFDGDAEEIDALAKRQQDKSILLCRACQSPVNVDAMYKKYPYELAALKVECFERYFSRKTRYIDGTSGHTAWDGPPELYDKMHIVCEKGIPSMDLLLESFSKYVVKGSKVLQDLRDSSDEVAKQCIQLISESREKWKSAGMLPPPILSYVGYMCKQGELKLHVVSSEERGVLGVFSSEEAAREASLAVSFPGDGNVFTQSFSLDDASMPLTETPRFDVLYNSSAPASIADRSAGEYSDSEEEEESSQSSGGYTSISSGSDID